MNQLLIDKIVKENYVCHGTNASIFNTIHLLNFTMQNTYELLKKGYICTSGELYNGGYKLNGRNIKTYFAHVKYVNGKITTDATKYTFYKPLLLFHKREPLYCDENWINTLIKDSFCYFKEQLFRVSCAKYYENDVIIDQKTKDAINVHIRFIKCLKYLFRGLYPLYLKEGFYIVSYEKLYERCKNISNDPTLEEAMDVFKLENGNLTFVIDNFSSIYKERICPHEREMWGAIKKMQSRIDDYKFYDIIKMFCTRSYNQVEINNLLKFVDKYYNDFTETYQLLLDIIDDKIILKRIEKKFEPFPILLFGKLPDDFDIRNVKFRREIRYKHPKFGKEIDIVIVNEKNEKKILENYFKQHNINCKIYMTSDINIDHLQ